MLSVLIPIYNYNSLPLVTALHEQLLESRTDFEIICFDDASQSFREENSHIASLSFCSIVWLPANAGRSKLRNLLVKQAAYDWLLFLDADMLPDSTEFISNYIKAINNDTDVVYGGLSYTYEKPAGTHMLRWRYGKQREALSVKKRRKRTYKTILFSNVLIRKHIVEQLGFDETISGYGYEDLMLSTRLKSIKARVKHIHNPACHLRLETSEVFLEKTENSLHNLKTLIGNKSIGKSTTRLSKTYNNIKKAGFKRLLGTLFLKTKSRLRRNLLSTNPSLFIFDIYKLGYFCTIDTKK